MEKYLLIATVLKPQGIRGEIKLKTQTDAPEDVKSFKRVFIDGTEYKVLSARCAQGSAFVCLRGVADRNAAELLRGKDVLALREDAPELPDGRHYIVDLIGCEVRAGEKVFGVVEEVIPAKTDVYTIISGEKRLSFAAADGVITDVDMEKKVITVDEKRFWEVSLEV